MLQKSLGTLVSCFLFVCSLHAQQLSREDVSEFRVILPDAPSVDSAGSKFDLPHGQLYGLLGDASPGVRAVPAATLLPLSNAAASVGGTLFDHRTSYFLSLDREAFDWSKLLPALPANTSLLSALGKKFVDSSSRSLVQSEAVGRFDHRFNEHDATDLRYSRERTNSEKFARSALNAEQQMFTIENAVAISPATVNETRGQITAVRLQLPLYALPERLQVFEATDNLDHRSGNQDLRGGGTFFSSEASIAGNRLFRLSSRSADFYFQNQWKKGPNLVLTAGVRTDAHNLGPLLGFAWSPGGSRNNVLRGGYGVAYPQISLPVFSESYRLGREHGLMPVLPCIYAEHVNFEFEHQFGESSRFLVTYQRVQGIELTRGRNSSSHDDLTVAFVQHPTSWGAYKIAYSYADGNAPLLRGWDNTVADQLRRASFTGTIHTPVHAGSSMWEQVTHGIALTGYGDVIRQNQFPGVDFVHLDARLSKEVSVGRHVRLELFLQRSGLLQHRSQSIANLFARMTGSDEETMRTGFQIGLRIRF